MKRLLVLAAAIAFALSTSPALGAGFSLTLSGPSTGVVGQPMILQASGQNPPLAEYWFPSWLETVTIDGGVVPACPPYYQDAMQLATATGGEWLAFARRQNVQADGSWSAPLGYTPKKPGRWLICGYTEDGATNTLAAASMTVDVTDAPAPAPAPVPAAAAKPVNTKAPRWTGATGGYTYRWSVGRKRGRTLRITRGLRGRTLTCSATASNAAGVTTAVSRPRRVR